MPDLDLVARSLPKPWRGVYLLMRRRSPPEAVADNLMKALAASLRESKGIPGFEPVMRVCEREGFGQAGSARTLGEMIRQVESKFGQSPDVKILAKATQKYMAKLDAGNVTRGRESLVKEHLVGLLRYHFFSRVDHRTIGNKKRFASVEEARQYQGQVLSCLERQLNHMAAQLASDPENPNIRAPRSRRRRLTTEELLNMSIDGGHEQW